MSKSPKVVGIVVTYQPNVDTLIAVLESSSPQVDDLVVVDNTPNPNKALLSCCPKLNNLHLVTLGDNLGIAYAHNVGIEWAYDHHADFVLLLDQDSCPQLGMVNSLKQALESSSKDQHNPIATGPAYFDPRTGKHARFMISRYGLPLKDRPDKKGMTGKRSIVSLLISSGTLIAMPHLLKVGGKRTEYFIDNVDTEWCLRVRSRGYSIVGVYDAMMEHTLGDEVRHVWFFHHRYISIHSPLRYYYIFRNTLLMLGDVEIGPIWRLFFIYRLFQYLIFFMLFSQARLPRLRLMFLGISHGLRRISGRLDPNTGRCTPIPKTKFDPA